MRHCMCLRFFSVWQKVLQSAIHVQLDLNRTSDVGDMLWQDMERWISMFSDTDWGQEIQLRKLISGFVMSGLPKALFTAG